MVLPGLQTGSGVAVAVIVAVPAISGVDVGAEVSVAGGVGELGGVKLGNGVGGRLVLQAELTRQTIKRSQIFCWLCMMPDFNISLHWCIRRRKPR